ASLKFGLQRYSLYFLINKNLLNYFLTFSLNILLPYFNELLLTLKLSVSPLAGANIDTFFNMTMAFFAFFITFF
ncbi:hypothetical protein, partial [Tenacibaculum mesophilum]|uniref:hypothetical protein n=1 Tax=Tenacibaculum mesophilum TaxID=104268 RepID=UPI00248F5880